MADTEYTKGFQNGRDYALRSSFLGQTADLPTRYRYRQEGAELERERILKLLEENLGEIDWPELVKLIEGKE